MFFLESPSSLLGLDLPNYIVLLGIRYAIPTNPAGPLSELKYAADS
jgi:hypothetical protein